MDEKKEFHFVCVLLICSSSCSTSFPSCLTGTNSAYSPWPLRLFLLLTVFVLFLSFWFNLSLIQIYLPCFLSLMLMYDTFSSSVFLCSSHISSLLFSYFLSFSGLSLSLSPHALTSIHLSFYFLNGSHSYRERTQHLPAENWIVLPHFSWCTVTHTQKDYEYTFNLSKCMQNCGVFECDTLHITEAIQIPEMKGVN